VNLADMAEQPQQTGKDTDFKTIASNRKASHDYFLLEKIEAGIALMGCEVKSVRAGLVSLNEAYADVKDSEVWLHSLHIQPYPHSRNETYQPARARRLLLHREQISRLFAKVTVKGHSLIPIRVYLTRGKVKIELALAKGKNVVDKRDTLRKKTSDREAKRAISNRGKD
jgi:SsrA-binding protein